MKNTDVFTQITLKAEKIFLCPAPTYNYNPIISGCPVCANGKSEKMYAVAKNTWRGFHKINKAGVGAGTIFMAYFERNKISIINALKSVNTIEQLDNFEEKICQDIRNSLSNIKQDMLASYNKVRKPVDLYIEHIVAMSSELEGYREKITSLLFLPLDSQMFQSSYIFKDADLYRNGLRRDSSFKDVSSKNKYNDLQETLLHKAEIIEKKNGRSFKRIYFDLLWNERYRKDGSNLFSTNL